MGVYYSYVNWDLEEYFGLGVGGFGGRLSGVGYTPSARALGLLLTNPSADERARGSRRGESIIGRWYQSRLSLEPDSDGTWDTVDGTFVDVSADVLIMLCTYDDDVSIARYCAREQFFVQVAHLVVTWQLPTNLRQRLEQVLGEGYQTRYAQLSKRWPAALHTVQLPQTLRWFGQR